VLTGGIDLSCWCGGRQGWGGAMQQRGDRGKGLTFPRNASCKTDALWVERMHSQGMGKIKRNVVAIANARSRMAGGRHCSGNGIVRLCSKRVRLKRM